MIPLSERSEVPFRPWISISSDARAFVHDLQLKYPRHVGVGPTRAPARYPQSSGARSAFGEQGLRPAIVILRKRRRRHGLGSPRFNQRNIEPFSLVE